MVTETGTSVVVEAPASSHEWFLVQSLDADGLLAVGFNSYDGKSVRKSVNAIERALLLPALEREFADPSDRTETRSEVSFEDETWIIHTERLVAPLTRQLIALHGVVYRQGEAPPPKPLVGAWEWECRATEIPRAFWDRKLFALYEVSPDSPEVATGVWATPIWYDQLIVPEDALSMRMKIDMAITQVDTPGLHTFEYSILTGWGTDRRRRKRLRLAGRAVTGENNTIWLRGISHEALNSDFHHQTGLQYAHAADMLKAFGQLAHEVVLCAIDTKHWDVFVTSTGWSHEGLQTPSDGAIARIIHSDDFAPFQEYLDDVAHSNDRKATPVITRLRDATGWGQFAVKGLRLPSRDGEPNRYVMCRLTRL